MATPVWGTFSKSRDGMELKFRIQELVKDNYEEVLNMFLDYHAPEEPVLRAANVTKNKLAFDDYKKNYMDYVLQDENFQVDACYLEDNSGKPKIVGVSIMYLDKSEKNWDENEMAAMLKTEEMKTFFKMVSHMGACAKTFRKTNNMDVFYDDVGVVVHPDYKGLGITEELYKARVETCKAHKVPVAGAWMTTIQSQETAAKLGWTTAFELGYKDLESIGGVTFEGVPPSAKLMIVKV